MLNSYYQVINIIKYFIFQLRLNPEFSFNFISKKFKIQKWNLVLSEKVEKKSKRRLNLNNHGVKYISVLHNKFAYINPLKHSFEYKKFSLGNILCGAICVICRYFKTPKHRKANLI